MNRVGGVSAILCAPLLAKVDALLLDLIGSLEPADWAQPTIVPGWAVRDVVAHLVDTQLRKLSLVRDAWFVEKPEIRSDTDLGKFVNRLNREGVTVYRRLSPPVLLDVLAFSTRQSSAFHEALDPFGPSAFAVSWAGESTSFNWLDTARELTERWHHQQQIRLALGRQGLLTAELYFPVLDCFFRAVPHGYRQCSAAPGTGVQFRVSGECGGVWNLERSASGWAFQHALPRPPDCAVEVPPEIAWRIFTRGITAEQARTTCTIAGDGSLADPFFATRAIIG